MTALMGNWNWSHHQIDQYRLCQKKLYNFRFFIAEKVNKAQQNTPVVKNIIFLCARRFLNGIIPWSSVKVMVLWVMSGKNKVGHFHHYCESHGWSPIFVTVIYYHKHDKHTLIYGKLGLNFHFDVSVWLKVQKRRLKQPSSSIFRVLKNLFAIWGSWPNFMHEKWTFLQFWGFEMQFSSKI